MLKSNSKKFYERLEKLMVDAISNECGETVKDNLLITIENLKAGHKSQWERYPVYRRPPLMSTVSVQYFVQSCGGFFCFSEPEQIKELASLYCETEEEKANYINRWQNVLDKKGYEPILEHYAYIISKGLSRLCKKYEVNI